VIGQSLQDFTEQVKVERRLLVELFDIVRARVGLVEHIEHISLQQFIDKIAEVDRVIVRHRLRKKYPGRPWL